MALKFSVSPQKSGSGVRGVNIPVTVRNRAGNVAAGSHKGRYRPIDIDRTPHMIGSRRFRKVLQRCHEVLQKCHVPLLESQMFLLLRWIAVRSHVGCEFGTLAGALPGHFARGLASCGLASCGLASCGLASCGLASCGLASCGPTDRS
jgi:hypothetical protein